MELISFVIPCYGSEKTIERVINEIRNKISDKEEYDYEIIPVNDCSPDNVWDVLLKISEDDFKVKPVLLSKNMNRPGAVMAGLNLAEGDIVIIMDDDGQCPMERLYDLIEPIHNGYDVSIADYPERKQSLFKDFGTFVNKKMTEWIINRPKNIQFTNFIAIKNYIVKEIIKYDNPYPYITGLILRTTNSIKNVPMEERKRLEGGTTFTFLKMLKLWINGLTAFSVIPLRISSLLGFICAGVGGLFGLLVILRKIITPTINEGWSSIIALIIFIGGLNMLMLGMIGEYLGRIYISINQAPQFVIRKKVNFNKNELNS